MHRGAWMSRSLGDQGHTPQTAVTTTLMAAVGMGGGRAWATAPDEREDLMLEAVRLAVEAGVELNAEDVDRRTALDAATRLGFNRVAAYLVSQGAAQR